MIEEQMSEEDLRAMNSKESAILTSNLSAETLICEQEIITDVLQLRTLANLCESLVSRAPCRRLSQTRALVHLAVSQYSCTLLCARQGPQHGAVINKCNVFILIEPIQL